MRRATEPYATSRTLRFRWSRNTKQHKTQLALQRRGVDAKMWSLNLPQFAASDGTRMCPFAGACADVCYASQGWYMTGRVKDGYEHNLAIVRQAEKDPLELGAFLLQDIEDLGATHIRPHDSGDFFAPWYVRAWLAIARELPHVTFYTYTKSIPLIPWNELPSNFRIVQSLGGTKDDLVDRSRSHSAIFPTVAERRRSGYIDGNKTDLPAIDGEIRIGLVYHGQYEEPEGVYDKLLRRVRKAV
jgi:hypothetical protein